MDDYIVKYYIDNDINDTKEVVVPAINRFMAAAVAEDVIIDKNYIITEIFKA